MCVQLYDRERFVAAGFNHHELFFEDGGVPDDSILDQFIDICEKAKGSPDSQTTSFEACSNVDVQGPLPCTARRDWGAPARSSAAIS